ncbi:MAG TPA: TonB-dependent receptor, partial [Bacteroidales bacterium]
RDYYVDTLIVPKATDVYFYTNRLTFRGEGGWNLTENMNLNVLSAYSIYNRTKNTYLKDMSNLDEILIEDDAKQDTTIFDNFLLRADVARWTKNNVFKYQLGIDFNIETGYGKRIKDDRQQIGDYAAFLSLNYAPISVLSIQPGIRYIYNTEYKAPLVYSINAKWDASEMMSIRMSLAKGFRAPSLKELYLDFVDINHNILGNENLEAETSLNINLSANYSSKSAAMYNWGVELNLFYNDIFNKIELAQINAAENYYTYINVDEFITQGYEFSFNNRIYPWLQLRLGVATTGRKLIDTASTYQQEFIYSTDFTAQGTFWWKKPELNFAVFYKYNGAYPQTYVSGTDEVAEQVVMSAYNSLDINVSRWFWKRRLNVQVGGKNLFNNTNISTTGTGSGGVHGGGGGSVPVNWGRTFFVHLIFNFTK